MYDCDNSQVSLKRSVDKPVASDIIQQVISIYMHKWGVGKIFSSIRTQYRTEGNRPHLLCHER